MKQIFTIISRICHCEAKPKQSLFWTALIFAAVLFTAHTAFAEVKTFEKEYIYQASEIDSKVTSRAIALEQIKRLLLEELGVYLMAETEVRDFQITKDRVVMLTAGIVQTEILNEKWDGEKYFLKARIKADPKEVAASVDKLRKDTEKSKELEDAKKKADEAFKHIENLKTELESVKTDKNKQREYAKAADTLSAMDWFNKGIQYSEAKEHDKAIEAYTKVIALENPSLEPGLSGNIHALSYYNRGNAYNHKGQFDRAIEDYDNAITLDPNYAPAYGNRGSTYVGKGQFDRAIEDFNKAIQLDPNYAIAFGNRGHAYSKKGQCYRAIEDYNKAIQLDLNFTNAYGNRASCYLRIGDRNRAIADYRKACDLGWCAGWEWIKNH